MEVDKWGKLGALALLTFVASGCSTVPQASPQPQPLVVANCPELAPLQDDTFGSWVLWAQYAAGQYAKCRAAALNGK